MRRSWKIAWVAAVALAGGCSKSDRGEQPPAKPVEEPTAATPAYEAAPKDLRSDKSPPQFVTIFYLPKPTSDAIAALRKHVGDKLPGARFLEGDSPEPSPYPSVHPVESNPAADWIPDRDALSQHFGRGLTQAQIEAVQKSERVLSVAFYGAPDDALRIRALSLQVMGAVAEDTGGLLWDDETREMFSVEAWRERSAEAPPAIPRVPSLITTHAYRDGELIRIVTLGMRDLGYPDVVVNDVPHSISLDMNELVLKVCQTIVERGGLDSAGKLEVDLKKLKVPGLPDDFELAEHGTGRVTLDIAVAEPQEGDADNRLIEIVFPGPVGQLAERQTAAIVAFWGRDDVTLGAPSGDAELGAASERARKRLLSELKPTFQPNPPPRHRLLVKAPFETPDGGNEFMWVEVVRWKGTTIHGLLMNEPDLIPDLKQGARVEVEEASVFDYSLTKPDGTEEGDETTKILLRQSGQ